jgi:hypothetical protein
MGMDIGVIRVDRTGGKVALVELEACGVIFGFRKPGYIAYRYKECNRVLDRDSLYVPKLVWNKVIRVSYGIFGR